MNRMVRLKTAMGVAGCLTPSLKPRIEAVDDGDCARAFGIVFATIPEVWVEPPDDEPRDTPEDCIRRANENAALYREQGVAPWAEEEHPLGPDAEDRAAFCKQWDEDCAAIGKEWDAPSPKGARQGEQRQETFLVRASEIPPVPISWVWPGWLARGKLHIIAGVPETGKTTCALSFAAIISAAQRWPDGVQAKLGNVLIWSNEDEDDDTIVPRLIQMGADLDRIFIVKGQADANGKKRPFNPSTDMDSLKEKAATIEGGVDLLILDPVVAAVPVTKNTNGNTETRAGLQPVKDFAEAIRAACIGITHFSKGTSGKDPLERVTGSLVYGALPRLVMMTSKNAAEGPDEPSKILVRAKSNIGPSGGGFGYEIVAAPLYENPEITATRIAWREEPLEGDARELLADAEGEDLNGKVSKVDQAKLFLKRALDHRERRQTEIESEAKSEGISADALKRASREGVKKRRDGILGVWFWRKQGEHFP